MRSVPALYLQPFRLNIVVRHLSTRDCYPLRFGRVLSPKSVSNCLDFRLCLSSWLSQQVGVTVAVIVSDDVTYFLACGVTQRNRIDLGHCIRLALALDLRDCKHLSNHLAAQQRLTCSEPERHGLDLGLGHVIALLNDVTVVVELWCGERLGQANLFVLGNCNALCELATDALGFDLGNFQRNAFGIAVQVSHGLALGVGSGVAEPPADGFRDKFPVIERFN